ncbi:SURF1 family protein [Paucibacter sp. B2R-40]|uniref:SURF1 family protein n=1 Tax=Paucibacter sp. B2R-40 TaxID=2893554 RepID=UPI0021E4BA1D|nr:SURF1 family protein [Paucibacter sp. B2R-40]MCV2354578.1 SURF1 family protein [Paucibacter sp. B2R-40]
MKASVRAVLLLLITLSAAGLTARLGVWQLDRAHQKESLQAAVQAKAELEPLQTADLRALSKSPDELKRQLQRRVVLRGTWLGERTVFLDNRSMSGRTGFYVVTPLLLEGQSGLVLVQRGWSPRDAADRSRLQNVPTPAGLVSVSGRLIAAPSKVYEFADAPVGPIRQNLDLPAYEREIGQTIWPVTVLQTDDVQVSNQVAPDGLLRAWQAPDAGLHKHYGYAFQWFLLSALILGLYVWFQTIRFRKQLKSATAAS